MAQHWGDAPPGRSPVSVDGRLRVGAAALRLLSIDVVLTLLVITGGARVLNLASLTPSTATEPATVAHVFALSHLTSFTDTGVTGTSPFGWAQLAGYALLSRAFDRTPVPVTAVRETMVLAAVLCAVLLWMLARRLGLPFWAATMAVVLMAVSPLAIGLQRVVLVEHLAVAWVLAALVLVTTPRARARPWHDVFAASCLLAAVLTSPLALLALPSAGWLLVRRREASRVAFTAVTFTLGLGIAFGPAGPALRPKLPEPGPPGIAAWVALDPVLVVLSMVAIVAGMVFPRTRPLAVTALLIAAVLALPSIPVELPLALLIPLTPLLVAEVAATVAAGRPPAGHRLVPTRRPVSAVVLATVLTFVSAAGWVHGFGRLGQPGDPALTQAREWLQDNASGDVILVDDASWTELAADGWPTGSLIPLGSCAATCVVPDWAVLTASGQRDRPRFRAASAVLAGATTVAVFGSVTVSRFGEPADSPGETEESGARSRAGAALAASGQVQCEGHTRDALHAGKVDPRLIATVAALATLQPVRLVDFPSAPSEAAADQPLRRLVVSGNDVTAIADFYTGQRATFQPASVTRVPGGVLVTYPLFPPSGLLTPFSFP
ncbi:phospholipid carrier-dependent glycosyltransferase [Amycolatopsis alba]|uniref:Phospholipid carrier-dependent glycosyltransferase n=1 Tax=Amycolatopsis alba DSM 44262 TaxID=1125972 RepID=A0A229S688_AMYAL|nr:phospholipid carrier-dependent glycosyltransferase [Amycolatopsis alba]OXM54426.1 phospholipid carrier-dependent glycosyltransferase [Amycolatopsis alba DSM 44262]